MNEHVKQGEGQAAVLSNFFIDPVQLMYLGRGIELNLLQDMGILFSQ